MYLELHYSFQDNNSTLVQRLLYHPRLEWPFKNNERFHVFLYLLLVCYHVHQNTCKYRSVVIYYCFISEMLKLCNTVLIK